MIGDHPYGLLMTNNDLDNTIRIAQTYGVREDNPLCLAPYGLEDLDETAGTIALSDRRLVRIDRLRLLGDSDGWAYPFLDVSYCYGTLADGRHVRVDLGEYTFPKRGLKRALVDCAKRANRYAKGLGLLDDGIISRLY